MNKTPDYKEWKQVPKDYNGWFTIHNGWLKIHVMQGVVRHRLDGPALYFGDDKHLYQWSHDQK